MYQRLLLICLLFAKLSYGETAIFAGGCFWCMEADFEKLKGVQGVIAGYTGGHAKDPSYQAVSTGGTGHYEAIKVIYNPLEISYPTLLRHFWHNVDVTDGKGQFCDRGPQYRSAIFYKNKKQQELALKSKNDLVKKRRFKKIATVILPAKTFYPAEAYHQNYYKKHAFKYKFYRYRCGRDARLKKVWGK